MFSWLFGIVGASVFLVEPTSFTVTEDDSGSNTDEEFCVQLDDDAGGLERDIPLSLSFGGSAGTYHFGSIIIILKPLLMCTVY